VFHHDAAMKHEIMMDLPQLFFVLVAAAMLNAVTVNQQIYRNEEFGTTLPIPDSAHLCPEPENEHIHGPVMLLGTAEAKGCGDLEHSRSILIFASYNVADDTKKLPDFLKWQCGGPCLPPPSDLRITGLPSAAARVNRSEGWIDIIVVTQAGKPDPDFDPSVPLINYDLRLHTKPEHLKEDLRVFRTVLETVRLSPAQ
jgi:hypothetical protein